MPITLTDKTRFNICGARLSNLCYHYSPAWLCCALSVILLGSVRHGPCITRSYSAFRQTLMRRLRPAVVPLVPSQLNPTSSTVIHLVSDAFLPPDATQSAVMPQYRPMSSVCLSVRPSVCRSVCDVQVCFCHIGLNTSKIMSRLISFSFLIGLTPTRHGRSSQKGTRTPKLVWNSGGVMSTKICNISETRQGRTKVTMLD